MMKILKILLILEPAVPSKDKLSDNRISATLSPITAEESHSLFFLAKARTVRKSTITSLESQGLSKPQLKQAFFTRSRPLTLEGPG